MRLSANYYYYQQQWTKPGCNQTKITICSLSWSHSSSLLFKHYVTSASVNGLKSYNVSVVLGDIRYKYAQCTRHKPENKRKWIPKWNMPVLFALFTVQQYRWEFRHHGSTVKMIKWIIWFCNQDLTILNTDKYLLFIL